MEADLEWWGNSSFMIGPFPVEVEVEDVRSGWLRDVAHLEDLRQTHDLDPMFTLRFGDGSTIEVLVHRPDDDGRFGFDSSPEDEAGEFTETDDVMLTASWLTEHGFVNAESTSSTGGHGSRLFVRADDWEIRYQCVAGTWTLELKPPQGRYVSFSRVRVRAAKPCWHEELPELISMLTRP